MAIGLDHLFVVAMPLRLRATSQHCVLRGQGWVVTQKRALFNHECFANGPPAGHKNLISIFLNTYTL
jgi:hypothetical protein